MAIGSHVWYASYGSNLLEERFLCYIRGGRPKGSSASHTGCRDKTLPINKSEVLIQHQLYFAKQSESWDNGGVAFLHVKADLTQTTLGRMYLITPDQFIDVVKQEIDIEGDLNIDLEKVIQDRSLVFIKTDWYGRLLYLGNQSGFPIFTFTSEADLTPTVKPAPSYLKTIVKGILETHSHLTPIDIINYLISKPGIKSNYSPEELESILENL